MLIRKVLLHLVKAYIAYLILTQLHTVVLRINQYESNELKVWENIFAQIQKVQKLALVGNEFQMDDQFNQSRYNVIDSPEYCHQSDAYKVVHPDVLLKDQNVWRDLSKSNLQKRIVMESSYAVLSNLKTQKRAGLKYQGSFPLQLSYIYTSVSSLYNNYHWGKGLGCTFQKYNHMPGKASVAEKNQLINNFMDSIKQLKDNNVSQECITNASFIPPTFRLNEKDDCISFFLSLNSESHTSLFSKHGPQFIIKTNAHRGEGITVLFADQIKEIKTKYQNGARCGIDKSVAIAQRYISNPFLYKGHKIEFRIYFFIGSTQPVIAYCYKRALIKRCALPFDVHSTERAAHVCNTAIVTKTTGLKEDFSKNDKETNVEEEEFFIDWNLEGLQELLLKEGRIQTDKWLDEYLYPRIYRSLIHMVRSTYFQFIRDSRYGEFFAVDFLLDNDLEVWVLEVNYNPQILSVTPDRILRNFKMIEDTLDINFAYIRSKYLRLISYLRQQIYPQIKSDSNYVIQSNNIKQFWNTHYTQLVNLQEDRLDRSIKISKDNLYVKIMDEGLNGTAAYNNLIQEQCLI